MSLLTPEWWGGGVYSNKSPNKIHDTQDESDVTDHSPHMKRNRMCHQTLEYPISTIDKRVDSSIIIVLIVGKRLGQGMRSCKCTKHDLYVGGCQ